MEQKQNEQEAKQKSQEETSQNEDRGEGQTEEQTEEQIEGQTENVSTETSDTQEELNEEDALRNSRNPERTKKYIERLKDANRLQQETLEQLTKAREPLLPKLPEIPNEQSYQNLNQQQIDDVYKTMVDENGYVDGNKLISKLSELDNNLREATRHNKILENQLQHFQTAQTQERVSEKMRAVHEKYPMLNPDNADEFDPDMWDYVRNELYGEQTRGVSTDRLDPMGAADKAYKILYQRANAEQKEKKEQSDNAKSQINATRPRTSATSQYSQEEEIELKRRMWEGKKGAVAEALKRRGL